MSNIEKMRHLIMLLEDDATNGTDSESEGGEDNNANQAPDAEKVQMIMKFARVMNPSDPNKLKDALLKIAQSSKPAPDEMMAIAGAITILFKVCEANPNVLMQLKNFIAKLPNE